MPPSLIFYFRPPNSTCPVSLGWGWCMLSVWVSGEVSLVRAAGGAKARVGRPGRADQAVGCADSPPVLRLAARRQTPAAHCVRCGQTVPTSQSTKRAARAATSPALLSAFKARPGLPTRAFASGVGFSRRAKRLVVERQAAPATHSVCGGEQRSSGVGTRSVLQQHTRRDCLTAANAVSGGSFPARPRCEQRSGVGQRPTATV